MTHSEYRPMKMTTPHFAGTGLGLRRSFINELMALGNPIADFYEVAPENWMEMGGAIGKKFAAFAEKNTVICHGLSLSIGSPSPLDEHFLFKLKKFLDQHNIACYSEHLSYCSDEGHLYDLMPIPFTEEAVRHVASRVKRVQEIIERPLVLENVSYYATPSPEMTEIDFLNTVLAESDCELLLDVNNIYVNSVNHQYHAEDFLKAIPRERINYIHIAGHYQEAEDLLIDTHGAEIIDPVWQLLQTTYSEFGLFPTLLERDFNIPEIAELKTELAQIRHYQSEFEGASRVQST